MAKIRSIKPNFFSSSQIANCSRDARLLFIGLWVFGDCRGINKASPHTLRLEVFPGDNDMTTEKTAACIQELIENGLIMEYEVNGEKYWITTGWHKHQVISRPNYRYPPPPELKIVNEVISQCNLGNNTVLTELCENNGEAKTSQCSISVETMLEQCSDIPGNGNGNGNDNGKEIGRAADASRRCSWPTVSNGEASTDIQIIFDYWRTQLNHPKAILDNKRRRIIQQALKNYSLERLKQAIIGCSQSKFHMGENPQKKRYDDISLIFRDSSRIESFIAQSGNTEGGHPESIISSDNGLFAGAI